MKIEEIYKKFNFHFKQCAELAGMDFTPIDTCTKTAEGQDLAVAHGTETLTLQPTLTFVPWVIYDKVKMIIKFFIMYPTDF